MRIVLVATLAGLLTAGAGGSLYRRHCDSPKFAVQQAWKALALRNADAFQEYVDLPNLVRSGLSGGMRAATGNAAGTDADLSCRQGDAVVAAVSDTVLHFITKRELRTSNQEIAPQVLAAIERALGKNVPEFRGVREIRCSESQAQVELDLFWPEPKEMVNLELGLRRRVPTDARECPANDERARKAGEPRHPSAASPALGVPGVPGREADGERGGGRPSSRSPGGHWQVTEIRNLPVMAQFMERQLERDPKCRQVIRRAKARRCIANMKQIETAKELWVIDTNPDPDASPKASDLYGPNRSIRSAPICPQGGTYTIGNRSTRPTCSIGSNGTPDDRGDDHRLE
jgi:hypothetical protein